MATCLSCRFLDHQHDFHLYYQFPYQIHYSNRSQSILGEQREGDKPTAIMKKQQQMTQYLNEKLAGNTNSQNSSKSTPKNLWLNFLNFYFIISQFVI
jgi:hypothetical protein